MREATAEELAMLDSIRVLQNGTSGASLYRRANIADSLLSEMDITVDEAFAFAEKILDIPYATELAEFSVEDYVDAVEHYNDTGAKRNGESGNFNPKMLLELEDDDFVDCILFMSACKRETYESDGIVSTEEEPSGMARCRA